MLLFDCRQHTCLSLPACGGGLVHDGGTTKCGKAPSVASSLIHQMSPVRSSPGVLGTALSPTTATVVIKPPSGGPWESYELTLCPVGGPATRCIVVTCPTTSCPVTGLTPGTSYVAQACRGLCVGWPVQCCTPCVALPAAWCCGMHVQCGAGSWQLAAGSQQPADNSM